MLVADPPPVAASAPASQPADVVVSRDTRNVVVVTKDTQLPLSRGGRSEDALLRQAIFLTSTLSVVRAASGVGDATLRWTHQAYLQRQLCVTSITGEFACALADVEELPEKGVGEAPLATTSSGATPAPGPAETARTTIVAALRLRATTLFEDDRRLKLSPMLKAAGVAIQRAPVPAPTARR